MRIKAVAPYLHKGGINFKTQAYYEAWVNTNVNDNENDNPYIAKKSHNEEPF